MSTTITVQSILDDAAARLGDPRKTRFDNATLLQHYNDALEKMTREWGILEQDSSFTWMVDEDRYTYPDDHVQMTRLRYNLTPSDSTTWVDVDPQNEDEFRARTTPLLPTGTVFEEYWARPSFFQVTPRPTEEILQGGLLTYWRVATVVATVSPTTMFELPNAFRLLTRDRLVIEALENEKYDTSRKRAVWESEMERLCVRIVDSKSDDRPKSYRPGLSAGASERAS